MQIYYYRFSTANAIMLRLNTVGQEFQMEIGLTTSGLEEIATKEMQEGDNLEETEPINGKEEISLIIRMGHTSGKENNIINNTNNSRQQD